MDEQPQDHPAGPAIPGRARGLRQVRRWSNGTAAALIAATVLATGYFARASVSAAGAAAGAAGTAAAGAGAAAGGADQPGTAAGTRQPCISVPVVTSGGSGVTRQTVIRSCGTGGGGSGVPVVITTTRSGEGGDN